MILGLTQGSGFNGFTPLVTLLFRHIIEDPATLRHTMEKVLEHFDLFELFGIIFSFLISAAEGKEKLRGTNFRLLRNPQSVLKCSAL